MTISGLRRFRVQGSGMTARVLAFAGEGPGSWRTFCLLFLLTAVGIWGSFVIAIVALDPFDTGHFFRTAVHGTAERTPRFAHASRGRDPRFDAAIFGNSHIQLLSPDRLKELTGFDFVSLTVPGSGVREKVALLNWFVSHRRTPPSALVFGIDEFECAEGDTLLQTNPFPFWVYAASPLEHLDGALNFKGVRSVAAALWALVTRKPDARNDGFWDYEIGRAWTAPSLPDTRGVALTTGTAAEPRGPAPLGVRTLLTALDKLAPETRIALVRPPVHASVLPAAGSPALAVDKACNDALSAYAASRPRTVLLNFRSLDPFFSGTEHYWDSTHYRSIVAQRIERDVAEGLVAMDR